MYIIYGNCIFRRLIKYHSLYFNNIRIIVNFMVVILKSKLPIFIENVSFDSSKKQCSFSSLCFEDNSHYIMQTP